MLVFVNSGIIVSVGCGSMVGFYVLVIIFVNSGMIMSCGDIVVILMSD